MEILHYFIIILYISAQLVQATVKETILTEYYASLTANLRASEYIRVKERDSQLDRFENLLKNTTKSIDIANNPQIFSQNQLDLNLLNNQIAINLTGNELVRVVSCNKTFSLKFLQLTANQLTSVAFLSTGHYVQLEFLLLNENQIDHLNASFSERLEQLRFLDVSRNKLKFLHPFWFGLQIIDVSLNGLSEIYVRHDNRPAKYLNTTGNPIECDCTLIDLHEMTVQHTDFEFDQNFKCLVRGQPVQFSKLNSRLLKDTCRPPNISYDISDVVETSHFARLEILANRWFEWFILPDDTFIEPDVEPDLNRNDKFDRNFTVRSLSIYRKTTLKMKCQAAGTPKPAVVWQTRFGYFTNLQTNDYMQLLFKMSNITRISQNQTLRVGEFGGAQTHNQITISPSGDTLEITNVRQKFIGKISCIAVNGAGADIVDFYVNIRTGVSDHFIYCLLVGAAVAAICCIIGSIVCAINEKHSLDSFPMTPPNYPTPLDTHASSTPPNFDINQWMTTAASNIHETLDQVRKKLHKGVEKASVTVKSLGNHSSAYLYSVYEHSSQRLSNIKSYVPSLNVPTISLPTIRYPNQLATRMANLRMGMADYFLQIREFCGTSDMMNTAASMATLQSETTAANAVGHIDICYMDPNDGSTPPTVNVSIKGMQTLNEDEESGEKNDETETAAVNV